MTITTTDLGSHSGRVTYSGDSEETVAAIVAAMVAWFLLHGWEQYSEDSSTNKTILRSMNQDEYTYKYAILREEEPYVYLGSCEAWDTNNLVETNPTYDDYGTKPVLEVDLVNGGSINLFAQATYMFISQQYDVTKDYLQAGVFEFARDSGEDNTVPCHVVLDFFSLMHRNSMTTRPIRLAGGDTGIDARVIGNISSPVGTPSTGGQQGDIGVSFAAYFSESTSYVAELFPFILAYSAENASGRYSLLRPHWLQDKPLVFPLTFVEQEQNVLSSSRYPFVNGSISHWRGRIYGIKVLSPLETGDGDMDTITVPVDDDYFYTPGSTEVTHTLIRSRGVYGWDIDGSYLPYAQRAYICLPT